MIRTVPVEDARRRWQALLVASAVTIVLPSILGHYVFEIAGAYHGLQWMGLFLWYSPMVTLPAFLFGVPLLNAALKLGKAGVLLVIAGGTVFFTIAIGVVVIGMLGVDISNLWTFAIVGVVWSAFFWVCLKLMLSILRKGVG